MAVSERADSEVPDAHSNQGGGACRYRLHGLLLTTENTFTTWPIVSPTEDTSSETAWSLTLQPGDGVPDGPLPDDDSYRGKWSLVTGSGTAPEQVAYTVTGPEGDVASVFAVDLVKRSIDVSWAVHRPETNDGVEFLLASRVLPVAARLSRGALPLHATAVEFDGRALVVCGESGVGKSTLTVGLLAAGGRLIGDEPIVLDLVADSVTACQSTLLLRVHEGSPALNLLTDLGRPIVLSRDKVGGTPTESERVASPPVPVAAVVLLGPRLDGATESELTPITGIDAVNALLGQRYSGRGPVPVVAGDFATAAALVERISVLRARLPDSIALLASAVRDLLGVMERSTLDKSPQVGLTDPQQPHPRSFHD